MPDMPHDEPTGGSAGRKKGKRNRAVTAVAALVILASGFILVYWCFGPWSSFDREMFVICTQCRKRFETLRCPETCPHCGAAGAVRPVHVCRACKHEFTLEEPDEPDLGTLPRTTDEGGTTGVDPKLIEKTETEHARKLREVRTCPKCGSADVRILWTDAQIREDEEERERILEGLENR